MKKQKLESMKILGKKEEIEHTLLKINMCGKSKTGQSEENMV